MTHRLAEIETFLARHGYAGAHLEPLKGDASFRRYVRMRDSVGSSYMVMDAPPGREDVRPFMAASGYLCANGFSAPRVLASDAGQGFLLLEDLGDDSFTRVLAANPQSEETLYLAAVDVLAAWHSMPQEKRRAAFDAMALKEYDRSLLMEEVKLFADWYLPQIMDAGKASGLRVEYLALWHDILGQAKDLACNQWVHRDYHADNLMWLPQREGVQRVGLLDFQDAVVGDAAYDMVSLLEDARRDVPPALAQAMIDHYLSQTHVPRRLFEANYAVLGAQRNCKIIGIFVRLCVRDGKRHYLQYLPRVWAHLERDLSHPALTALRQWMEHHAGREFRGVIAVRPPGAKSA